MTSTKSTRAPVSLVTGACGFMGSHMIEILKAAGHEVRATDLASACAGDDRKVGRFPSVLRDLGVEPIPADLTQPESFVGLVDGVDYVFHIAALFNYSVSWEALRRVNVDGTQALLEIVRERAPNLKRFVLWGAGGVYGFRDREGEPMREDWNPEPPNDYLRSKWRQEWSVIEAGKQHKLPYTIIRPTTVYGPRCVYGGGQLLMGTATTPLSMIPSNFTGRIPFVHVHDVCRAALFLSTKAKGKGEVFNLNDDSRMTTVDFMKYVASLDGRSTVMLPPVPVKTIRKVVGTAARAMGSVARVLGVQSPIEEDSINYVGRDLLYSNEKLKKVGYRFEYPDAKDGVRDTLQWYRQEGWI